MEEKLSIEKCKKCPYVKRGLLDKILGRIPENNDCEGAVKILISAEVGIDGVNPFMNTFSSLECPEEVAPEDIEQSDIYQKKAEAKYENARSVAKELFDSLSEEEKQAEIGRAREFVHWG